MAEGLKAMALEGHGIAFLPFSAVKKDLSARRLVSAVPLDLKGLQITMEIRVYRERPLSKESGKIGGHRTAPSAERVAKSAAQALWDYLLAQGRKDPAHVVPQ